MGAKGSLIEQFARMSSKDKVAIERYLSAGERKRLHQLLERQSSVPQKSRPSQQQLAAFSTVVAQRIADVLRDDVVLHDGVTPATRHLLSTLMTVTGREERR